MRKALRTRLAALLEAALLAEFGIKVLVPPEELYPAEGWYRTSPQADCFRWTGSGKWQDRRRRVSNGLNGRNTCSGYCHEPVEQS